MARIKTIIITDEIIFCVFLLLKLNILSPHSTERILYMNFSVFASFMIFVVFLIWVQYEMKKRTRYDEKTTRAFLEREAVANSTRRQNLDGLDYIQLPLETFPVDIMAEDETVQNYLDTLRQLSLEKIVNFTGISNTELKLTYGVANLPALMEYDQHYTLLVKTLQNWAEYLYDNGYENQCLPILEFALSTNTDISSTYRLLATIYVKNGDKEKLDALKLHTQQLNSAMKKPIDRMLQKFDL